MSTFSDHQTLKLQEAPDMVPVGELPRHMLLSADRYVSFSFTDPRISHSFCRYLTGQVVPGSRVIATGVYSTFQAAKAVSVPLIYDTCVTRTFLSVEIECRSPCASPAVLAGCTLGARIRTILEFCGSITIRCPILTSRGGGVRRNGSKRRVL